MTRIKNFIMKPLVHHKNSHCHVKSTQQKINFNKIFYTSITNEKIGKEEKSIKEMPLEIASVWLALVLHVGWHQQWIKEGHSLFQVLS